MDLRVVLLCVVTVYGKTPEYKGQPYYRPNVGLQSRDARGQASEVKEGFVQPLDFSHFTQQFVGEDQSGQGLSFGNVKTSPGFGADSKKSGAFQLPNSEFAPFPESVFPDGRKVNKTGFVQPVQFVSPFDGSNSKVYKTNISPTTKKYEPPSTDQLSRATEGEDEGSSYFQPSKLQSYRHSTKPRKVYVHGKSSYPPPHKPPHVPDYHSGLLSKHKDVEMILPKDKVLFLPMVNGKPKPYDGYRAPPESEGYETFEEDKDDRVRETSAQREKRLNEGEIIYGRPKIALSELYHRQLKRSPAEYYGGIYPYYDYSDAKLSVGGDTDPDSESRGKKSSASNQKRKKAYPKKHRQRTGDKPYNPYKYPKENKRRRDKDEDSDGYASEESSEEVEDSEEETDETREKKPIYKYTYDNSFSIPELEIKTYPYERKLRDSEVEGSRRDETYEDNADEYTAGYEKYIKTLPADLESYFGTPDLSDKFSVEATQNLENNKNCKKVEKTPEKTEEGSSKAKREAGEETQICYICSDPKTGDNYEQCAYRSQPKSQKYFFGGTTSFQTNETAEPTTYRYKRSTYEIPYNVDPYAQEESESKQSRDSKEIDESEEYPKKPKKKAKKKYKKKKSSRTNPYGKKQYKKKYDPYGQGEYSPFYTIEGSPSKKKGRAAKLEQPPISYDGPLYTYEGPEETYEGPSQPYEGPKKTYEGPAEPYEGPINQEYYDTTDERIQDDDEEEEEAPKQQEYQGSAPTRSRYDDEEQETQRPKKRQSYSSHYSRPYSPSRYSGEYESFRPHGGYSSDYRFGPEHFVDEGEPEDTKQNEEVKATPPPKTPERRGPHKFPQSESRSAAASDKQEKEEIIGEVKSFKNGDVCQKKRKEGMICMVCKNEKTGATYEQCQYSTKPKDKYYAYGSQKSYTTKNPNTEQKEDDAETDQYPEKSDIVEKKILIKKQSKVFGSEPTPNEGLAVAESNNSPQIVSGDLSGEYSDNIETLSEENNQNDTNKRDFTESVERIEPRDGIEGLEEYLYDAEDSEKKATEDEKQSYRSYDDYFHDLFPDFSKGSDPVPYSDEKEESESETHLTFDPFSNIRKFHEENSDYPKRYSRNEEEEEEEDEKDAEASRPEEIRLKDRESRIPPDFFLPYNEENHKKDLEKALGEFQNRDWSNCKKIVKKKLTCYQCVDKNGVNNEECMYVEASQPITKHLAYHERKELKPNVPETKNKTIEPVNEETVQPEKEKTLKRFRKTKNSQTELIDISEPSKNNTEYLDQNPQKGDFEGVDKSALKTLETTQQQEQPEEPLTSKPKRKKQKRNPKKRNKTIRNETTTERFEKIRKRKYPLKKFTENDEKHPENNKTEVESTGLHETEPGIVTLPIKPTSGDTGNESS